MDSGETQFEKEANQVLEKIERLSNIRSLRISGVCHPSDKIMISDQAEDHACQTNETDLIPIETISKKMKFLENEVDDLRDQLYESTYMTQFSYDNKLENKTNEITQFYDYNTFYQEKSHQKHLDNARRACRLEFEQSLQKNYLQKYKKEILELRKKINSETLEALQYKMANKELTDQITKLKQENNHLKNNIKMIKAEKSTIPQEIKKQIFDLETIVEELENEKNLLKSTTSALISELKQKLKQEQLNTDKSTYEINKNQDMIKNLQQKLEKSQILLEDTTMRLESQEQLLKQVNAKNNELDQLYGKLKETNSNEGSKTAVFMNELQKSHEQEVKELQRGIMSKDKDIESIQSELNLHKQNSAEMVNQINMLTQQLENKEKKIRSPKETPNSIKDYKEFKIKYLILHKNYIKLKDEFFTREKMLMRAASLKHHSIRQLDSETKESDSPPHPSPFSGAYFIGSMNRSPGKDDIFDTSYSDDGEY